MRRMAAALLTAYALTGSFPAAAAPAWVTAGECTDDGGTITPVGEGMAVCSGGMWDQEMIHPD